MTEPADEDLLAAYAAGDPQAARRLVARLAPRVYAHAARLLGDRAEAEDVTQEALLRLWRLAPDWRRGEARVSTWLYRVTANLCIDRQRRRRRHGAGLEAAPEIADPGLSAEARIGRADRAAALEAALAELPPRQRQAVVLRHIDGLGNAEIARIMDIGPRAVESLTARGKRMLETLLLGRREELGHDDDGS
ncbi:RNA polymerase sigma factor [Roseivivax sp. CAU 1761]